MMGQQPRTDSLFYYFRLEDQIPEDHLLKRLDRCIDFGFVRERLRDTYSAIGRPSIDPEVLLRLLLIGYLYGITSERRLLEEVRMHLACRCALPSRSVGCETNAGTYGPVWNSATEPCSGQGLWKRRVSGVAVGTRYPTAYSSYRSSAPNTGALHRRAVSL